MLPLQAFQRKRVSRALPLRTEHFASNFPVKAGEKRLVILNSGEVRFPWLGQLGVSYM